MSSPFSFSQNNFNDSAQLNQKIHELESGPKKTRLNSKNEVVKTGFFKRIFYAETTAVKTANQLIEMIKKDSSTVLDKESLPIIAKIYLDARNAESKARKATLTPLPMALLYQLISNSDVSISDLIKDKNTLQAFLKHVSLTGKPLSAEFLTKIEGVFDELDCPKTVEDFKLRLSQANVMDPTIKKELLQQFDLIDKLNSLNHPARSELFSLKEEPSFAMLGMTFEDRIRKLETTLASSHPEVLLAVPYGVDSSNYYESLLNLFDNEDNTEFQKQIIHVAVDSGDDIAFKFLEKKCQNPRFQLKNLISNEGVLAEFAQYELSKVQGLIKVDFTKKQLEPLQKNIFEEILNVEPSYSSSTQDTQITLASGQTHLIPKKVFTDIKEILEKQNTFIHTEQLITSTSKDINSGIRNSTQFVEYINYLNNDNQKFDLPITLILQLQSLIGEIAESDDDTATMNEAYATLFIRDEESQHHFSEVLNEQVQRFVSFAMENPTAEEITSDMVKFKQLAKILNGNDNFISSEQANQLVNNFLVQNTDNQTMNFATMQDFLTKFSEILPTVTDLNLENISLDSESFQELIKKLPNLTSVNLRVGSKTEEAQALANKTELMLRTDEDLKVLANECKKLDTVNLTDQSLISKTGFISFLNRTPVLKRVTLVHCNNIPILLSKDIDQLIAKQITRFETDTVYYNNQSEDDDPTKNPQQIKLREAKIELIVVKPK